MNQKKNTDKTHKFTHIIRCKKHIGAVFLIQRHLTNISVLNIYHLKTHLSEK